MKLSRFQINGFRSIKEMEISILENNEKKCLVLVGKNEAGKSNILKAIAAVFSKYEIRNKDLNKDTRQDQGCIRAIFELEENDFDKIEQIVINKLQLEDVSIFENNLSIKDFIQEVFKEIILQIYIKNDQNPFLTYWKYTNNSYKILNDLNYDIDDLQKIIFNIIKTNIASLDDLLEKAIYWEYNDKYLLPSSVSIREFKYDPDTCLPLKNIFYLNGYSDIQNTIEMELEKDKGLHGFLDKISKYTTIEFRKIWSDLKNINFVIRKDGDEFDIRIQEKEFYSTEDRSDGFKRFIAILLMLSVQDRTKDLSDKVILFDEPDIFLYPTSAKFLKEELLKIAKQSIVIYSTHSPFMIDNDCIERHLVIERKDDVSQIIPQEKSPYQEDELLKRAIGSHLFETIRSKNIIFEGFMDYKVFKMCHKDKDFQDCGLIYMGGIKEVFCIATMMMLTGKKFIIVSDSDDMSRNKKRDFQDSFPDFGNNWLEYSDVNTNFSTLEDFYNKDYIKRILKKNNFNSNSYNESISAIQNLANIVQDNSNIKKVKNELMLGVRKNNIKKEYFDFISKIKDKLQNI